MAEDDSLIVREEIERLGIDNRYFNIFYMYLRYSREFPLEKFVPREQIEIIADYFRDNQVLDEKNVVIEEGLESFVSRVGVEDL